jgi:putative molybdopterin biosynthesis protein
MQIENRLQRLRAASGLSAAALAGQAGITRQAIYAIEAGNFVPNTSVALRLARALGVTVEQIFSMREEQAPPVRAQLIENAAIGDLVRLCRVNGRLLAVPARSAPSYLPAADGLIQSRTGLKVSIDAPLTTGMENRILLAGCDPALSLLNELLQHSGIEVVTVPSSSRRALAWLKQERVHAAGSHLLDRASGEYNLPFIRRTFPSTAVKVVAFASWEQGIVVHASNPKSIRSLADLGRKGVTFLNREKGSGSRDLLDRGWATAGIPSARVKGYDSLVSGHLAAAYAVAAATADCCIAPRSAARCFGLDFIPLAVERFDLAFTRKSLESPGVNALLDLLNGPKLRSKLQLIAGYDTSQTGRVLL